MLDGAKALAAGERGYDVDVLRDRGPMTMTPRAIVVAPQCLPGERWEPDAVLLFIEEVASRYRVDRERVYLIGYSMGGYGAWHTAAAHPNLFAAVVPICGGGEPGEAKSLAGIPIWAFHGAIDDVVPLNESEQMVEAIRDVGGEPKFTVLADAGHGICELMCQRSDLWEWLFQLRKWGE